MKAPKWYRKLEQWVEGDARDLKEPKAHDESITESTRKIENHNGPSLIRASRSELISAVSRISAVICCFVLLVVMMFTVAFMPTTSTESNVTMNETAKRYIEQGMDEVGATNLVANIILVYRGFDTYGESCVLFLGATAVIMLLANDRKNETEKDRAAQRLSDKLDAKIPNQVLVDVTKVLMPVLLLYGAYILCNGHLSPGGGFAGGSLIGGAMILCENAYGVNKVRTFFGHTVYHAVKVGALVFYAALIMYTIFVGSNGLENIFPKGTPGSLLSAGIILPINIAVGLEVACTMYAFYTYFVRGEL